MTVSPPAHRPGCRSNSLPKGVHYIYYTVKLGYYVPSREIKKRYVVTKVRSIQNAIFLTGRTGSTCSHERSATEDASPSWMWFIIRFSYGEIAFQGIVNLKTCREIEIDTERLDDMLVIRKKKNQRKGKTCSWRENWRVISDFVPRPVRLIRKKCTCCPIGDVRDRRRERYNRVYIVSRVCTNQVSL